MYATFLESPGHKEAIDSESNIHDHHQDDQEAQHPQSRIKEGHS
jgi:hypothetical protein